MRKTFSIVLPSVSLVLAVLLGGCFLLTWLACGLETGTPSWWWTSLWSVGACEPVQRWGLAPAAVWLDGEWSRVFTAIFVHGSWLHLGLNIWSLLALGPWVEAAWGRLGCLCIFGLSGIAGCLASVVWAEAALVVGASGGILGLAGALWVARTLGSVQVQRELQPVSSRGLAFSLALLLLLGFVVPVVAQAGHVGGLSMGAALGMCLSRASSWRKPVAAGVVAIVGLALLGGLAQRPSWRPNYFLLLGYSWLERGEPRRAVTAFRQLDASTLDGSTLNALAYALAEARLDLPEAEQLVRSALEEAPEDPHRLDTLGWIHCLRGDTTRGTGALLDALRSGADEIVLDHLFRCPLEAASMAQ